MTCDNFKSKQKWYFVRYCKCTYDWLCKRFSYIVIAYYSSSSFFSHSLFRLCENKPTELSEKKWKKREKKKKWIDFTGKTNNKHSLTRTNNTEQILLKKKKELNNHRTDGQCKMGREWRAEKNKNNSLSRESKKIKITHELFKTIFKLCIGLNSDHHYWWSFWIFFGVLCFKKNLSIVLRRKFNFSIANFYRVWSTNRYLHK